MENGRRDKTVLLLEVITGEIPGYTDSGNDPEYCRYKKRLFWNQYKKREASGSNRDQRVSRSNNSITGMRGLL
jgi:hypothetical protein